MKTPVFFIFRECTEGFVSVFLWLGGWGGVGSFLFMAPEWSVVRPLTSAMLSILGYITWHHKDITEFSPAMFWRRFKLGVAQTPNFLLFTVYLQKEMTACVFSTVALTESQMFSRLPYLKNHSHKVQKSRSKCRCSSAEKLSVPLVEKGFSDARIR